MPMDAGYADAFPLARSGGLFLAIVGAAIVAVLGVFAIANAWLGVRLPAYGLSPLWTMDGAGKLAAGLALFGSHHL